MFKGFWFGASPRDFFGDVSRSTNGCKRDIHTGQYLPAPRPKSPPPEKLGFCTLGFSKWLGKNKIVLTLLKKKDVMGLWRLCELSDTYSFRTIMENIRTTYLYEMAAHQNWHPKKQQSKHALVCFLEEQARRTVAAAASAPSVSPVQPQQQQPQTAVTPSVKRDAPTQEAPRPPPKKRCRSEYATSITFESLLNQNPVLKEALIQKNLAAIMPLCNKLQGGCFRFFSGVPKPYLLSLVAESGLKFSSVERSTKTSLITAIIRHFNSDAPAKGGTAAPPSLSPKSSTVPSCLERFPKFPFAAFCRGEVDFRAVWEFCNGSVPFFKEIMALYSTSALQKACAAVGLPIGEKDKAQLVQSLVGRLSLPDLSNPFDGPRLAALQTIEAGIQEVEERRRLEQAIRKKEAEIEALKRKVMSMPTRVERPPFVMLRQYKVVGQSEVEAQAVPRCVLEFRLSAAGSVHIGGKPNPIALPPRERLPVPRPAGRGRDARGRQDALHRR